MSASFVPFCPAELRALEYRDRIDGGEWSEKNIFLKKSPRPGWWKNDNNPPLKGIMDVLSLWHVRVGVIRKGIQTGGTQALYNMLTREADYSNGHDNALVIMADEKSVKKHGVNRLRPLFEYSPNLRELVSDTADDITTYSMKMLSGFRIDIGWATSEVSLASESYRIIIFDEISKYTIHENIDEGKGRATTFEDTKRLWFVSSPDVKGKDPMEAEEAACEVKMEFWPVCPYCKEAQPMRWENFDWPGKECGSATSGDIRRLKSARYACCHCGSMWDNNDKNRAVKLAMAQKPYAGWVPDREIQKFTSVAFAYPGWLSPFVSLSECVAKWIEAQKEIQTTGRDAKLKKWTNTIAGEQYERETIGAMSVEGVLRFRSDLPRNLVPPDTYCLGLVADTQQSSFYYQVWAFGYSPQYRMHMVRHGIVEKFIDLEGLLQTEEMKDHTGMVYRIDMGLIDSGGTRRGYQKHSRTVEVYEWCSRNRQVMPVKGAQGRNGEMISYKDVATYPGTNIAIPGLLKRANLRVDLFKDELERRLAIEPDDPGALSFHDGIDEAFAKHYTTEYKDEAGAWTHNRSKGRNDYFDCNGYALGLLEMIKLRIPMKPEPVVAEEVAPVKTETQRTRRGGRW